MKIDAKTALYGIIGYPLGHTFSPAMHNAAFSHNRINAVYLPFPVKNLLQFKHSMRQFNIKGISVTIPHKINIRRQLDQIHPLALQIGSVNTVLWGKAGLLEGYNTDGLGAVQAIKETGFQIKNSKILLLGSGGSARSIAFSLAQEQPAKIGILSRNPIMSMQLARNLGLIKSNPEMHLLFAPETGKKLLEKIHIRGRLWFSEVYSNPSQIEEYNLIINTTPLGMSGHPSSSLSPLQNHEFSRRQTIFDIVYNPQDTPLIHLAKRKKADYIPGYKMLLYQGALQFELFTGQKAPVKIMEKALKEQLTLIG